MLISDITILDKENYLMADENRIWLSAGTIRADKVSQSVVKDYDPQAILPKLPWEVASADQRQALISDTLTGNSGSTIQVIQLSKSLLQPFERLHEATADKSPPAILKGLRESKEVRTGINKIVDAIRAFANESQYPLEGAFIGINPSNKITVTYSPGPRYVGLHIDSWYDKPITERQLSPGRFCANLGTSDRYLLFINLSVMKILETINTANCATPPQSLNVTQLKAIFAECYPNYPVVKLKVAPGEAYIAPTENMIHDGSSEGNQTYDIQLTVRGVFNFSSDRILL